jgi:hypothetical protein
LALLSVTPLGTPGAVDYQAHICASILLMPRHDGGPAPRWSTPSRRHCDAHSR